MPNGLSALDAMLPRFTGRETTEQKLAAIQNYLYMLLESLRYALANLEPSNWNKTALDGFVEMIRAGVVVADTMISSSVITQNLYATYGSVAELTVDRLLSGDKLERYLNADSSDVNYIKIQDQTISFITGSTDGSQTEQLMNRNNEPMYWKGAVTGADYKEVGMTTAPTAFPVTVYRYAEQVKMKLSFELDSDTGYYIPKMTLGVGTSGTDPLLGKGYIWKDTTGITLRYTKMNGTNVDFHIGEDGITGLSTDSNDVKVGIQLASVMNAEAVTVTSEETTLGAVGISVASDSDVPIYVSLSVMPSDATHAAIRVYLDGSLKLTRKFVLFSTDEQSLCCTGIIDSIAAGDHTLTFKAAADDANMTVAACAFLGYAIIPGSAYQSYAAGLIAYYEFNDAADSGSLGMDLTACGSITYAEGKVGNCAVFNGSNWYYFIDNTMLTDVFTGTNDFSIAFWFKTSATKWQSLFYVGYGDDIALEIQKIEMSQPYTSGPGIITYKRGNTIDQNEYRAKTASAYNDGTWHMLVASYDGENAILNMDNGEEIITVPAPVIVGRGMMTVRVASTSYSGKTVTQPSTNNEEYIGSLDQLRIYNYALSAAEIADLWNGGLGK